MSIDIIGWVKGWHLERFVEKLFAGSKTLWDKLGPGVQQLIIQSSSIVAIINTMLDATPQFLKDKIFEKLGGLTEEKAHSILEQTAKILKLAPAELSPDFLTLLANIQKHLKTLQGTEWEGYSETLSNFIALYNTPPETTFSVIASVMKFAYNTFVKGRV